MIAKGQPCPNCRWSEESADPGKAAEHQAIQEEYSRRHARHIRNYATFMALTLALGMVTLLGMGLAYLRRGVRVVGPGTTVGTVGETDIAAGEAFGIIALLLGLLWVVLTVLLFLNKRLMPRELNCPKCEVRIDELGVKDGHCPSCQVKLC
jgi:hypothetical protein